MDNETIVKKTIESSTFASAGGLNTKQQDAYLKLIRTNGALLSKMTPKRMTQRVEDVDTINLGEPVTEAAAENTLAGVTVDPHFTKVTLNATKLRSRLNVSHETILDSIEQGAFDQTLMEITTTKIASDIEKIGIRGDSTISGTLTDANSKLLRSMNGVAKLTDSAHVVDVGGAPVDKDILAAMLNALPDDYTGDPGLRYLMAKKIEIDYRQSLGDRLTNLGDVAITSGGGLTAYGIPIIPIPLIPTNLDVVTQSASGITAEGVGIKQDPFRVDATNNKLKMTVQTAIGTSATFEVTFTVGSRRVGQIADEINVAFKAAHASWANLMLALDNGAGSLVLRTPAASADASITMVADSAVNTAGVKLLGFWNEATSVVRGPFVGEDANTDATTPEGTFIWLCNPANFMFGMVNGSRILPEYNKDFDRLEVVVYNYIAFAVSNLDAVVKAVNVTRNSI